MKPKNLIQKAFTKDPNLFLAIAVIACAIDLVRVMPLALVDANLEQSAPSFHLFLGLADLLLLVFFSLATPKITTIVAMSSGALLGVVTQSLGLPALSGWISISIPWLLCNRHYFLLTRREKLYLVMGVAFICSWGTLVFTGHVVDPGMQGENSIGWLYSIEPAGQVHPGLLVQFRKGNFLFVRRVQEICGDEIVLGADNPSFGEDYKQLRIPKSDVTGRVNWLLYPKIALSPKKYAQWQKKTILIGSQAIQMTAPAAAGLYHNTHLRVWVVVNYEWNVLQSGTGTPHVIGDLLASVDDQKIQVYNPLGAYEVVSQHDYNEVGTSITTVLVYSSNGEVLTIEEGEFKVVGKMEEGESLCEAARRLHLPQLQQQ